MIFAWNTRHADWFVKLIDNKLVLHRRRSGRLSFEGVDFHVDYSSLPTHIVRLHAAIVCSLDNLASQIAGLHNDPSQDEIKEMIA